MKKINYRQYYYNGDYYNKELLVPEECKMYEVGLVAVSHQVKDREETWAKTYVLICPTEFENAILLGNVYFNYLDDIFVIETEVPILDVDTAPRFNNVYSIGKYKNPSAESKLRDYLGKIRELREATEDDLKEMTKLYQESTGIGSICMLRRLTYTGIEASNISFKSWIDGSDEAIMAITKIGYGTLLSHDFVADPDVAKLFQKKSAEIYKSIVNNE